MKILLTLCLLAFAGFVMAGETPYNERADAKLEIKQALAQAATNNLPVIVVFGANWCADCKLLDKAMKTGASAPLIAGHFKMVKVYVGQFDENLDVAKAYEVPLEKGIPAVAILSSKNEVLYVTKEGELAGAQKMGDQGIYDFFKRVTVAATVQK